MVRREVELEFKSAETKAASQAGRTLKLALPSSSKLV